MIVLSNFHPDQKIQQPSALFRIIPVGRGVTSRAIRAVLAVMLIFMTANALGWRAFVYAILVAGFALKFCMLSCQWKCSLVVIKSGIAPAAGSVTRTAICAKLSIMLIVVGVTGKTVGGRAFISVCMTCLALYVCVLPCQREGRVVVIEGHVAPSGRVMARSTIRAELAVMLVIVCMAGKTIPGCPFVYVIHMARLADHIGMCTRQRERRVVVIERRILPTAGVMTGRTDRSELTVMCILRRMTGEAILWRPLEYIIHVTGLARHIGVQAIERKRGVVMIERHIRPFRGLVTRTAVRAKLSIVRILRGMAGEAVLRRALIHVIYMTGLACNGRVCAGQRKSRLAVIETHVLPAAGVMARGAHCPELAVMDILRSVT